MKSNVPFALVIVAVMASAPAMANLELALRNNCMTCHTIDRKVVGPAFQDIARKYASDKAAEATLIEKIRKGGVGVWGPMPMPPGSDVKAEDINQLVKWVLALDRNGVNKIR